MTETSAGLNARARGGVRRDRPDSAAAPARVAELEAEVAALRRALARAGAAAEAEADRGEAAMSRERDGRAADAAEARSSAAAAEARHGREVAAGRADLATSEAANDALRRANAELSASRAALRGSEERLRLILDSAVEYAIFGMDPGRRVTSWNAGAERLLGWREDEIVGRSADVIFTPEDRAAGAPGEEAEGAVRDGRAADERWHVRKDGTRFWANGLMLPLRDPDADPDEPPAGLLKIMRDETGKRRAESDMALERAHLSAMLDLLPAGVGIADRTGRVARGNPALRRIIGDAVPSASPATRERWVHPDGSRIAPRDFVVARALRGEAVVPGVEFLRLSDGGPPRWTRVAAVPVPDPEGGGRPPSGAVMLVEDIHEVDAEGRYVSINGTFTRMSGYAFEDFAGRAFWDFIEDEADRRNARDTFGRLVRGEIGSFAAERAYTGKHGRRWWAEITTTAVRDGRGRFLHAVRVVHDTTARRQAEEALRESEARFRALAQASSGVFYRMCPKWTEMRQLSGGGFIADAPEPTRGWMDAYIHPDDRGLVQAAIDDAIRRKGVFELEHRVRRPDGGLGWTLSRAVPILGADGGIAEWFGAASDVTARKEAEGRLREAEARQAFLLRLGDALRPLNDPEEMQAEACRLLGAHLGVAQVGFGQMDERQERITIRRDWNDGRLRSVVGTWRIDDFGPAFAAKMRRGETAAVADIAHDPCTAEPEVAAAYAAVGARSYLDVPLVKGGRMVAMLFVNHPEPRPWSAAEVEAVEEACARLWDAVGRARAEEALRESEGHRRAALAAARLGTFEWDLATGAVSLDARARDIFGFPPGEGVRADDVFARIHPDDGPRARAAAMAAAAARARVELDYRVVLPGGAVRAVGSVGEFRAGAGAESARMTGVVTDITDRRLAEERRALLVNELNHRVKNTLAVVQSIALQTARGAADLHAFSQAFQARLIALARAHDLLTQRDWRGAPLGEVARAALDAGGGGGRVDLSDCASGAVLPPAQALALSLALHELATNALKHGALSAPGGRVSVACRPDPAADGAWVVEWAERGGPPVAAPPARRGFGLRLLERGLASQAGLRADLRFEPGGVRCVLRLPPPAVGPAASDEA